jgi:hypothetical protein
MEAAGLSENLRTLRSVIGEAERGDHSEAEGLSVLLRSMIGEAERGDHSEAEGLSVLLGLMMSEAKVGGDPSEADG